ncbi:glycosyltransferase family 2 protein [Pseudobutyrivibrio ruminis]|nr:glycosyltransferase family 2 protein [Pseudobutyrivibrio ruminis]
MKKLSIIIPSYNSYNTITRLIESINEGDNDSYVKVIVVDDHSNEDEQEKIKNYCDKYNNVIFAENDFGKKGAGGARNKGIELADTEWIMFADSDDYFLDGWFTNVNKYLNREKIEMVCFCVDGKRGEIYSDKVHKGIDNGDKLDVRVSYDPPWGKLYRLSMIKKNHIRFDEIKCSNDVMFSVRTGLTAQELVLDNSVIYYVDEVPGSITKDVSPESYLIRAEVVARKIVYMREALQYKEYKRMQDGLLFYWWRGALKKYGFITATKVYRLKAIYEIPFMPSIGHIIKRGLALIKRNQ